MCKKYATINDAIAAMAVMCVAVIIAIWLMLNWTESSASTSELPKLHEQRSHKLDEMNQKLDKLLEQTKS